ncbi:hypothetical protein OPQ81_000125 [Rhizoctonia solani]|nr:hypothetical protein OPQ81_000125 [Rhizoctonia solani]
MHKIYFLNLPLHVAKSAFCDAVEKFILNTPGEGAVAPKPLIHLQVLDNPTLNQKHAGCGSIEYSDEKVLENFMIKLKTEPIMFGTETVAFSRGKPPNVPTSSGGQRDSSASQDSSSPPEEGRPQFSRPASTWPRNGLGDSRVPGRLNKRVMNLNRGNGPKFEKRVVRRPNDDYLRRLRHRLSILGDHLRLETLEFGVLRNWNFSVEYSRSLIEETGYFIFEDDEKSLRISIGGSHQDSITPSVAIAIQTVNYVALGNDTGKSYMFLALSQNPQFELGDIARSTTGKNRDDERKSRNRLSALDERHARVAPRAPTAKMCQKAGLPLPEIDPPLSFSKLEMYSLSNVAVVEKWFQGGSLPGEIAFQIEALFRNGTLVPEELMAIKPVVEQLAKESKDRAADLLRTFRAEIQGAGAQKTFNDFENKNVVDEFNKHVHKNSQSIPWERIGMSKSTFMCYQVKITPTAVHLNGPLEEQSNRVIRRYPGYETHFIRVAFTDEADNRTRFDYEVDTHAFTQKRLGQFLKNAIQVCDRLYEFLGYSQSGFRENACLYIAPFEWQGETINGEYIRHSLGNFNKVIHSPSRYGARMSQAFSATSPSIILQESEIKQIPEIQRGRNVFSDGCATISRELAKDVWDNMLKHLPASRQRFHHKNQQPPVAFQIRIGGSKGMVRLNPKLKGRVLCLRPSMIKFDAEHERSLEIARAFENYGPCFLNRPLVILLWSGGVEDEVFLNLMKENLDKTMSNMTTLDGVARLLIANRLGSPFHLASTFHRLSRLALKLDQPNVRTSGLHKLLNATLFQIKRDLKHKARIRVPDSYTLVGVCDENNYLRPRQIYACVQNFDQRSGVADVKYLEGRYLITRSPVIHPGDAQVVWAIGEPPNDSPFCGEGNNLPNVVVFSTRGDRPVPNMLGGGDIAEYENPGPKKIGRPSTIDDVADFMVEYICHDALGLTSINHLVIASTSEMRARDDDCITNAGLHSMAVDSVKNGHFVDNNKIRKAKYPIEIDEKAKKSFKLKPDWLAGHGRDSTDGRYYECQSVLGKLFRAVDLPAGNPARESDVEEQEPTAIQNCIARHVARYKDEIQATVSSRDTENFIRSLFLRYVSELNHICVAHTISSESAERVSEIEVMLGTNLEVSSKPDLIERMKSLTRNLASYIRNQLNAKEDETDYVWLGRAWKAYLLTSKLGDKTFGAFSFSWLALDSVLDALQAIDEAFLPHTGPILPPFDFVLSRRPEIDEDLPPPDYDSWNDWTDAVPEKANGTEESNHRQNAYSYSRWRGQLSGGWGNGGQHGSSDGYNSNGGQVIGRLLVTTSLSEKAD